MKRTALTRKPWGEKRKQAQQWEAQHNTALEGTTKRLGLFSLHHVDWLHISTPQRDTGTLKQGHPDYMLMGKDWLAFLETKGKNMETGRMGGLRANQRRFHERLAECGAEVWTARLPDDLQEVNLWLRSKTGIIVNVDGLMP